MCSHLLIEVLLSKVTVLQYCASAAAELLDKCRFMEPVSRKMNVVAVCLRGVYFLCLKNKDENIILYNAQFC